jgi:hypothetical protein
MRQHNRAEAEPDVGADVDDAAVIQLSGPGKRAAAVIPGPQGGLRDDG